MEPLLVSTTSLYALLEITDVSQGCKQIKLLQQGVLPTAQNQSVKQIILKSQVSNTTKSPRMVAFP